MTLQSTLEAQLQALGSRKVTAREFPQASRWGTRYLAYTSLSGRLDTFIFLGSAGAVRMGASPSASISAEFLREKLLARAARTLPPKSAKPPKAQPRQALSLSDLEP